MRPRFAARLAFVLVVVAEVAVLALAVRWLGGWPVFWLLLATALLGGWFVRREGVRAWSAAREALQSGRTPSHDMSASAMIVTGGLLLILPGFVTDVLGTALIVPLTRPVLQRASRRWLPPTPGGGGRPGQRGGEAGGSVIEGEVIDRREPPDQSR